MPNYETNMINYLKRNGLDKKYDFAGIYCIKIDDEIDLINKIFDRYYFIINSF